MPNRFSKTAILSSTSLAAFMATVLAGSAAADVTRKDMTVSSAPGIDLFVRQVRDEDVETRRGPVLLLHGARVGGLASFDVDVDQLSLAEDLAEAGHTVYIADLRGYGRSSFPPAMDGDRFGSAPAVPTAEAVEDVKAVLDEIASRHGSEAVGAMGWATGSHWLAATEAAYPGSIDYLVFYNSVYGGEGEWSLTENFAAPGEPATFNYDKFGAYRLSDAASLVGRWTEAEGISDAFVDRYVELAMEGDPTAAERDPESFRHPSGPIADTLKAVNDAPLYDAGNIRANVIILRSDEDFWSRPVDVETMTRDLTAAGDVTVHELPGASHYVHLEPGEGRASFFKVVTDYLADGALDEVGGQTPNEG
ncbi:alpha-beta hydrolase superfamily lysophospholipase [Mesorhizobium sp. J18]|uniref:alpha/beta fold hydrolase n=1 Tax=Mesorhizobium sp. J18 TaxID=935263 RepID=UPI00119A2883|nr:alpha/beta fold hydrolase [Mesorhizobium sp. J18]TWG89437.1 alpha-beta hydrolase superfamily lysophospholipase [Mesorhizobium sp. J18]